MSWNLKKHGDLLESTYADFIEHHLPSYSKNWRNYIGNNGMAQRASLVFSKKRHAGTSGPNDDSKRIKFSEAHYTCLESIVLMKRIVEHGSKFNNTFETLLDLQNDFLAFHANSGRIRDNIKTICYLFFKDQRAKNLLDPLEEFYQKRNQVLHGRKLPFGIFEGEFMIVLPQGKEENVALWNSNKSWKNATEDDLEFCSTYLSDTFNELLKVVEDILANVFDSIMSYLKEQGLMLDDPPPDPRFNGTSCISDFSEISPTSGSVNL